MSEPSPSPIPVPEDDQDAFSVWNLLAIVRQRLRVAVAVFAAVLLAVVAYTWTRVPKFTATARLLIETRAVNLTDMQDAFDPLRGNIAQRDIIQTQVQLLTSTPVLRRVLQTGIFDDNPAFLHAKDPVALLAKMIKVLPAPSGYILDVSATSESPQRAAAVVNALVDAYRVENRARRTNVSDDGILELKKKSDDLRTRLDTESAALQSFMVSNRMVSFEDAQNIIVERLQGINKNLLATEPKRILAETQYKNAQAALDSLAPIETIPGVLESSIISSLKMELAKLQRQESDLSATYGENHSQLKSVRTQIDALQGQIRDEASRIVDGLRGRYEQIRNEEAMLRDELKSQETEVLHFNELAAQYRLLRQTRDSLQDNYNSLIRRIDELDISNLSGQGDSVFVISRAEVPNVPSWPNRKKFLLLGLFFGALLSIGVCFLLDYLDTTVKSETDVQNYVRRPLLGSVPSGDSGSDDSAPFSDFYALDNPRSNFAEAFRTIRTYLSFSVPDHPVRSLVVSSTGPSEGKTLCAVNLAIAAAMANKRTLIVDADLRKPRLGKLFPDAPAIGLSDLLAGDSSFSYDNLVSPTQVPNLSFLSAGTIPPTPVELLESQRFASLLAQLTSAFDMVIFDAPPCLNMVDALVIGRQTDGLVYVLRAFSSNKFATRQSVRQIELANINILGAVLNDVDLQKNHYYYYYASSKYYTNAPDAPRKKHRHHHKKKA